MQGHRASSRVEAGTSGFLFSSDMDLGVPMEFQQGSQASSCVETWNSASLSTCKRGVRLPVEWTQGAGAFSRGSMGLSPLPSCFESIFWVPVKSMQGNQAYLEWIGKRGLFELRHDSWECARVSRGDRPPPEGRWQHRDSFPDKAGKLNLISIRGGGKRGSS